MHHTAIPQQVRLCNGEHVSVQFAGDLVESLRRFSLKHPDMMSLLGHVVYDYDAVPSHLLDGLRDQVGILFPHGASLSMAFDLLQNFVSSEGIIIDPRTQAAQMS